MYKRVQILPQIGQINSGSCKAGAENPQGSGRGAATAAEGKGGPEMEKRQHAGGGGEVGAAAPWGRAWRQRHLCSGCSLYFPICLLTVWRGGSKCRGPAWPTGPLEASGRRALVHSQFALYSLGIQPFPSRFPEE